MKLKKFIACGLTFLLMVSAFGCSDKKASKDADASKDVPKNMNAADLPILKTPETYTIAIKKDAQSAKNQSEKECSIYSEKKTNVKVNWNEIPSSGWTEKTNVMFASGDLPDAFAGGVDVVKNMKSLVALDPLIEKYGPHIRKMFNKVEGLKKAETAPDGKIYSLPAGDNSPKNLVTDNLYVNQDWLTRLNLKIPATLEEFYDVLKAFKTRDPNGNGKADEIPLAVSEAYYASKLDCLYGMFGTLGNSSYIRIEDGKCIFTPAEEGYYEGLKFFHKLYSEKLMNQDYFTESMDQFTAKGFGPETTEGFVMSWTPNNIMEEERSHSYVPVLPMKGPKGDSLWYRSSEPLGAMSAFTITTKCKEPAVLLRWYDFQNSSLDMVQLWNYGPEGSGCWRKLDDGKWEVTEDNVPEGTSITAYRRTIGTVGTVTYNIYCDPDVEAYENDQRTKKKIETVEATLPFTPKEVMPVGLDTPENVDKRNLLSTDISHYMSQFQADAIMKGINDNDWQSHLNKLKTLKINQYTKLWQDFYNSHK